MDLVQPFRFSTERHLVELTGLKASDLSQLLASLREVPGSSVFYHTHQRFLSHHFEKPVVYNDFAVWVGEALRETALSERTRRHRHARLYIGEATARCHPA